MLKERLYYIDAYCKTFTTQIKKEAQDTEGNWYVVLENTAFYPTGGGQPHDIGTLNDIQVLNVEDVEGEIRHTVATKLGATDQVKGVINWERRFDHMQQHAGQHILTAAFVELFKLHTISFHLGKEICTIDLDAEDVSSEQLEAAERLANEMILKNLPIETKWVSSDELDQYSLRKELTVTDEIRLVIVPDFDYNGCGGTHPSSTGQVNAIKILATEKQRRKTRVHFVCGERILRELHKKTNVLAEASRQLSAPEDRVNAAIEKLLEANHSLEKSLGAAHESLLSYEANELLLNQEQGAVKAAFVGRTVQELQKLARFLVANNDEVIALLVAESDGRLQFVAGCGAAVKTSMKQVATVALQAVNGKGGGNDAFVQGGGERTMSGEELLEIMAKSIL
ncbi:alanine--tRNA ligase-related protein [Bacillus sp. FJAT-50079]|uniref:alanyl-tRNA editing protein n=1 Tax=Bacillus sp. FJAT-50079 TaxID=2833577 RepID=UPI001BC9B2EA|nr:alanine--tRNA ligase-related protein [Bacillus sp. FJAT-50079]MBS4207039.1 alanyl-tRNA editing protein [Bacillus sp. FJAT-50079]